MKIFLIMVIEHKEIITLLTTLPTKQEKGKRSLDRFHAYGKVNKYEFK